MEEKKLELIEKISKVFMHYGIKSVTMDDLATKLGVSKKTLYVYFKDKKDMVRQMVTMKTQNDAVFCENAKMESENAIAAFLTITSYVLKKIREVHPSVFFDMQKYHNDAWQILEKHRVMFIHQLLKDNMIRGIKEGIYREDINVDILPRVFIGRFDTAFDQKTFPPTEYSFEDVFNEMLMFHLRGMVNEKGLKYLQERLNKEVND